MESPIEEESESETEVERCLSRFGSDDSDLLSGTAASLPVALDLGGRSSNICSAKGQSFLVKPLSNGFS